MIDTEDRHLAAIETLHVIAHELKRDNKDRFKTMAEHLEKVAVTISVMRMKYNAIQQELIEYREMAKAWASRSDDLQNEVIKMKASNGITVRELQDALRKIVMYRHPVGDDKHHFTMQDLLEEIEIHRSMAREALAKSEAKP